MPNIYVSYAQYANKNSIVNLTVQKLPLEASVKAVRKMLVKSGPALPLPPQLIEILLDRELLAIILFPIG